MEIKRTEGSHSIKGLPAGGTGAAVAVLSWGDTGAANWH